MADGRFEVKEEESEADDAAGTSAYFRRGCWNERDARGGEGVEGPEKSVMARWAFHRAVGESDSGRGGGSTTTGRRGAAPT